jgi:hypothetical protein
MINTSRDAYQKVREDKASLTDIKLLADSYVDKKNADSLKGNRIRNVSRPRRPRQSGFTGLSEKPGESEYHPISIKSDCAFAGSKNNKR